MARNDSTVRVRFLADVDGINRGIKDVNGRLSAFETSAKRIGVAVAGVFAAEKIVQAGRAIIDAASNLEQAAGATEAIFGPSAAKAIDEWARKAAGALGLSATDAMMAANRFATAGKQMGLAGQELVSYSTKMTQAGADLAAMFGGTVPDAVNAISSALRGELDPIERYGIAINQAAVDAEAAALGFQKLGSSWDQAAKGAAITSLIEKQMALNGAVGAFSREADTYAGQTARLAAEWENFQAALGQAVLPAISNVVQGLRGLLQFVQQNTALIAALGVAATVAAGRLLLLRNAAVGAWLAEAIRGYQGLALAVQLLGVRATAAGVGVGALNGAVAILGSTAGIVGIALATATAGIILMNQEARRTEDILKKWGLEDERAAGKIKTNTSIIGAAMKMRAEKAAAAAWSAAGAWSDANGRIVGSTYQAATATANAYVDAANAIIGAANQAQKAWEAGQANGLRRSNISGTVSSAIAAAGAQTPWLSWTEVSSGTVDRFKAAGGRVGGAAAKGATEEVERKLRDWSSGGTWEYLTIGVDTAMRKASASLVEGYTEKLNALKDAGRLYEQAVKDALAATQAEVEAKARDIQSAFLGFNLNDFVKTNEDGSTIFDSAGFQQWLGDKTALSNALAPLVGVLPAEWIQQIGSMDTSAAKATVDYLLGNNAQNAAEMVSSYTTAADNIYKGLAVPLAETYRAMYWEAQEAGLDAAKEAVKAARQDFQEFVRKQLKTKIVIDVEYREVNAPPTGAGTVRALQQYEALNGIGWRT